MPDNFSDPAFIQKLKDKDSESIRLLVEKYNVVLFRGALSQLKDPVMAEEMVQDSWHAFFTAIDRFEGKSHIRTFLFGILFNKIRERRRHTARFVDTDNPEPLIDGQFLADGHWKDFPMSPEKFVSASQDMSAVESCMAELGEKQKQAFYLKEVVGEATEDICNILEVSATNLGVLVYRAKNQLRKCLEGKAMTIG